jgi:hypothetical protein
VGLSLRYLTRYRRAGGAVLVCVPLVDLTLLVATAVDLRGGGTADWTHGLAAVYIGFSVGYGRSLVRWADVRFAYRFADGARPGRPPKYGTARARYEWTVFVRTLVSAAVAAALLEALRLVVADADRTQVFGAWLVQVGAVTGVHLIIAASYTVFPKRAPAGRAVPATAGRGADRP